MNTYQWGICLLIVGCQGAEIDRSARFELDGASVEVIADGEGLSAALTEYGASTPVATLRWDRSTKESTIIYGALVDLDEIAHLEGESAARFLWSAWARVAEAGGPERFAELVVIPKTQEMAAACSAPHNCPGHPDFGKCNPTNIYDSCCVEHDRQYCDNCCSASSWLPFVGSRECNAANRAVVGCFIRKLLGPGDGHNRSGAGEVGVGMQEFLDRYWGPMQEIEDRLDCHFDIACDL